MQPAPKGGKVFLGYLMKPFTQDFFPTKEFFNEFLTHWREPDNRTAAIDWIFATIDQACLHQFVNQMAGGRFTNPKMPGDLHH
jgi:hypothetical protein